MSQPTAVIITLGCRLNQADSARLAEQLRKHGFQLGKLREIADLIIINSCTVTGEAADKTLRATRVARRRCPDAYIVVTGCEPQINRPRWNQEKSVNLVLDNAEKEQLWKYLPDYLKTSTSDQGQVQPGFPVGSGARQDRSTDSTEVYNHDSQAVGYYPHRTRANLKIQEGCDNFCSYCIVPYARGKPRSRPAEDVLHEAHVLLARGHRELVLTGVNLSRYQDGKNDLLEILARIAAIPGDFRLRLSSVEPGPIIPSLIKMIRTNPKICRFLHLPLQYGDNSILKAMNRPYRTEYYMEMAKLATSSVPGLCLGTDLMVGFPGENEYSFDNSLKMLKNIRFGNLHIFRFSPRPGTRAANLPRQIPDQIAIRRQHVLQSMAKDKERSFAMSHIQDKVQVLVEKQNEHGDGSGWSDNYLRIALKNLPEKSAGNFVVARIDRIIKGRQVAGHVQP